MKLKLLFLFIFMWLCSQAHLHAQNSNTLDSLQKVHAADVLYNAKDYAGALTVYLEASEEWSKINNQLAKHYYPSCLVKAANCYYFLKKYEEADSICEKLLGMELDDDLRASVKDTYVCSGYMEGLTLITDEKKYEEGRARMNKVLPYADNDMANRIRNQIASTWADEGSTLQIKGKYQDAYHCFETALQQYQAMNNSYQMAYCQGKLGHIKQNRHQYQEALAYYDQALAIVPSDSIFLQMSILQDKRTVYQDIQDYQSVNTTNLQIDSLCQSTNDPLLQTKLYFDIGKEAFNNKNYSLAESYYLKSQKTIPRIPSREEQFLQNMQLSQSMMYLKEETGDHTSAITWAQKKIDLAKENARRIDYLYEHIDLAKLYAEVNDSLNAFRCVDSLLVLNNFEIPDWAHGYVYNVIASVYEHFNNWEKTLAYNLEAMDMMKKSELNSFETKILAVVGRNYMKLGRYEEAKHYLEQHAQLSKDRSGRQSNEYGSALYELAVAEAYNGEMDAGRQHYTESAEILERNIREELRFIPVTEREHYWNELSERIWNMTAFAISSGSTQDKFTETCYNGLLFAKSLLLESDRSMAEVLQESGNEANLDLYQQIIANKDQITILSNNYTANQESITSLNEEIRTLSQQLAANSKSYGDFTDFLGLTYSDVRAKMRPGDVLIDFTDYIKDDNRTHYVAYIINNSQQHPLLVDVFTKESIDSLLNGKELMDIYDDNTSQQAARLVWSPLIPHLQEGCTVYYVPSGMLSQMSIESLSLPDGSLLGQHYHFVRLSSARELFRYNRNIPIDMASSAVLYGGLDYDLDSKTMAEKSKLYEISSLLAKRGSSPQGNHSFTYLLQAKKEVEMVDKCLKKKGLKTTPRIGQDGTEESFLSLNGNAPQLMLISTHGFYFTPEKAQRYDYLKGYQDAMMLTGLLMTGGNNAWQGKELPYGVHDGILKANEIAKMDLRGLHLVVLSACQTGEGKVTPEGVYGLQRAFKKAGAETIIMTLWDVNELATRDFVTIFFQQLTENGWDKRAAFDFARDKVRETYERPYFWAGFAMLD